MTTIHVGAELRLAVEGPSPSELSQLCNAAIVSMTERKKLRGRMVGVTTKRKLFRFDGGDLVLPRGMTSAVRVVFGAAADWTNDTTLAPFVFNPRVPFRPAQTAIADAVAIRVQGIALAATGAGKTGAACATIAKVAQRTLVLVPTVALAQQWADEVRRFLGIEASVCTGGDWSDAPVVIATPATALQHGHQLNSFGLLVVDEVQGFATDIRLGLLGKIPARYRVGLTATLPTDHRGEILARAFGPVIYRFGVDAGLDAGIIVAPAYEQIPTGFSYTYKGPGDWAPMLDALVANTKRNTLIVDTVIGRCAGVCTLVLSGRLAHLDRLRDMFTERGARVAVLSGATPAANRETIVAAARAGELDVLLGSTVADEGVDIPGLGALVLAFPSKAEPRLLQRIGRVVRAAPGKARPMIFDLVDEAGPLKAQARVRRDVFVRTFVQRKAA